MDGLKDIRISANPQGCTKTSFQHQLHWHGSALDMKIIVILVRKRDLWQCDVSKTAELHGQSPHVFFGCS